MDLRREGAVQGTSHVSGGQGRWASEFVPLSVRCSGPYHWDAQCHILQLAASTPLPQNFLLSLFFSLPLEPFEFLCEQSRLEVLAN